MQHAISRMQRYSWKPEIVPAWHRHGLQQSLKRLLLDKIHVLYLKAISRMPKHDLCSRHHRGLLKAGHCFGPFDPVNNTILNTIWYDTMFPASSGFEVQLVCTKSLARIERLSLFGLVAFTRIVFPSFSNTKLQFTCLPTLPNWIGLPLWHNKKLFLNLLPMVLRLAQHSIPVLLH